MNEDGMRAATGPGQAAAWLQPALETAATGAGAIEQEIDEQPAGEERAGIARLHGGLYLRRDGASGRAVSPPLPGTSGRSGRHGDACHAEDPWTGDAGDLSSPRTVSKPAVSEFKSNPV